MGRASREKWDRRAYRFLTSISSQLRQRMWALFSSHRSWRRRLGSVRRLSR